MVITREKLLQHSAMRTELVTIPGESEQVLVRNLTNLEVIAFGKQYGGQGMGDYPLLLWGVIDEDGNALLKADDLPAIMSDNADKWMPLVSAINRLSGFTISPKV